MLSGVLLHVIQTTRPVNPSLHFTTELRFSSLNQMYYSVLTIVYTFDHSCAVERTRVAGLSSAGWVKGCAIQYDAGPTADAFRYIDNACVEFDEM